MAFISLSCALWLAQVATDHQAIVKIASEFAAQVKNRDAAKMAQCFRLVCHVHHPENDGKGLNKPNHEKYALHFCRYLLAYQECAQSIQHHFDYEFVFPNPHSAFPIFNDISEWVDSIKNFISIHPTTVNGQRCYEYQLRAGKTLRFVNQQGIWYLGSLPFCDIVEWDGCRNYPAIYAISDLTFIEIPWYFKQAAKMAEQGKSKKDVFEYLQKYNLLHRDDEK